MLAGINAFAQEEGTPSVQVHGFIRNFYAFDTRECVSGTEDFFMYLPKDENIVNGEDLNSQASFRTAALTSRLWVEAKGYKVDGISLGARIEADFYSGVSGVTGTATLRMRQAFLTMAKNDWSLKLGQAWHPLAADLPDVTALNAGAPFNPFSRTPLVSFDYAFGGGLSLSASAIWQMQYCSAGPGGQSANYIKYAGTPEIYLGLNYSSNGFLGRVGVDLLSIKPRWNDGTQKVSDRITTFSPFVYLQYKKDLLSVKFKSIYAQAGEHMNLNGGYGISGMNADGSYEYTPTVNSSSWLSVLYGKKVQGMFFAGYAKNFGTIDALYDKDGDGYAAASILYFSKNSFSNMNQMVRVAPAVIYNLGKLALALEYELTAVQYGDYKVIEESNKKTNYIPAKNGLCQDNLHWIANNRIQVMAKFTF